MTQEFLRKSQQKKKALTPTGLTIRINLDNYPKNIVPKKSRHPFKFHLLLNNKAHQLGTAVEHGNKRRSL